MSDALMRTKRSLDLIPFILEHQGITMEELAKKFNVSKDVLFEDLNMLFCCGLPGYTPLELIDMSFDDGFVSVSNPQVLSEPRKLSKTEMLRLHLGLQLVERYSPDNLKTRVIRLKEKISQLLNYSPSVELIEEGKSGGLKTIVNSIQESCAINFKYASANSDSITERNVRVIGIWEHLNRIYIEANEISNNENKTFRLDRMSQIQKAQKISDIGIKINKRRDKTNFSLMIKNSAQAFISENSLVILESHKLPDGFEVILGEVSEVWLISEILAYGGEIKVLEPKELMREINLIAKSRLSKS